MVDVCGIFALVQLACDVERFFAITLFGAVVESGFCIMVNHCRHLPCCESRLASWKDLGLAPDSSLYGFDSNGIVETGKINKIKTDFGLRLYCARLIFPEGARLVSFHPGTHGRVISNDGFGAIGPGRDQ